MSETEAQLLRRIAHALRTPLGLVGSALQELGGQDDPLAELGQRGARQLARIADRLTMLGRVRAGLPVVVDGGPTVALREIVTDAVELVAQTRPRRRITVAVDPDGPQPRVAGDRELLHFAVVELVDNAVRFASSRVRVAVELDGSRAVVRVTDDGPGIATNPGSSQAGIGVGLELAEAIASAHGGRTRVEAAGPQTCAVLTLPSIK